MRKEATAKEMEALENECAVRDEQYFLATLIANDNEAPEKAVINNYTDIKAEDGYFYRYANELIFKAMVENAKSNKVNDLVGITETLKNQKNLEKAGGIKYVTALANNVSPAASMRERAAQAERYFALIEGYKAKRDLLKISKNLYNMTAAGEYAEKADEIDSLLIFAENEIGKVRKIYDNKTDIDDEKRHAFSLIDRWDKQLKGKIEPPISTNNQIIDYCIGGGVERKKFYVVAARPSHGKTTLATNLLLHFARSGYKSLYFSLEMSKDDIEAKIVSSAGKIEICKTKDIRNCENDDECRKVFEAGIAVADLTYAIDDSMLSVEELIARMRREKTKHGIDIVIVDHLHMLYSNEYRSSNREQEVRKICNLLHAAAKNLDVVMIVLAQLNRAVESRTIKMPGMADLRDSGGLEEYADAIVTLYRPYLYDQEEPEDLLVINVPKIRMDGHNGAFMCRFTGKYSTIDCPVAPEDARIRDFSFKNIDINNFYSGPKPVITPSLPSLSTVRGKRSRRSDKLTPEEKNIPNFNIE